MTNNLQSLFFNENNIKILLHISRNQGETSATDIAKNIDLSYQNVHPKVNTMNDLHLVDKDKSGQRKHLLSLTEYGEELAREFERLNTVFRKVEAE